MREIDSLRGIIDKSARIFKVRRQDLYASQSLRNEIKFNRDQYIMQEKPINSFERQFHDARSKLLAEQDTEAHSQMAGLEAEHEEIQKHNVDLVNEYEAGELGIDMQLFDHRLDDRIANPNKMKRDLRAYVNSLKVEDPQKYRDLKKKYFDENYFADLHQMKVPGGIENIVKLYPGGPNGPKPEDNVEHYSDWFMRNHPDELIYGKRDQYDYHDLGVRWKYIQK